jgi:hypothetical protein
MAKNKKNDSENVNYYGLLVLQRFSLLLAVASTVVLWATLIAVSHSYLFTGAIQDVSYINIDDLNAGSANEINTLTAYAALFSLIAGVITLVLAKAQGGNAKKTLIDGLAISGFCFVAAVACQPIYRFILTVVA